MKLAVLTPSGTKSTESVELPKTVFEQPVKSHQLVHYAYRAYLANKRSAKAKTLTRGEVQGGGRKPWKQKGTGRARTGSIRSPIWRGGGITFGPTGDQNHTLKISKKTKRAAVKAALSLKIKSDSILVINSYPIKEGKTKEMQKLLTKLNYPKNTLLVTDKASPLLVRATKNIPGVELTTAAYLNVYRIINADMIVFSKPSIDVLSKWLEDKNAK
jgi:large subunit ribosomal protein L4